MSASVSSQYVPAHDPLCPAPTDYWRTCYCDLIAKAHRRGFLFGWGEGHEQGRIDMLAKCIEAVQETTAFAEIPYEPPTEWHEGLSKDFLDYRYVMNALRALLRNDSVPDSASVDIDAYLATLDAAGLLELHRKIIIAREQGN